MDGKLIWKEIFIYSYFFCSVGIVICFLKFLFTKTAAFFAGLIEDQRLRKLIHGLIMAGLWTLVLFPYMLATFTIHRPKIGDKYDPSIYGYEFGNVSLKTEDGLILRGWFIPNEISRKAVVIGHGLGANKSNFLSLVNLWHSMDYSVLIFDFRGHGNSDGHTISFGYKEKYDIRAGFDYLKDEKGFAPNDIAGYGVSFGGAALIHAVSNGAGFEKIVTDSSFSSIDTMAKKTIERLVFVPEFLVRIIKNIGLLYVSMELGFDVNESSPIRALQNVKAPWLIIHGKKDDLIPSREAFELYRNAHTIKKLYLVDGAGHYATIGDADYRAQVENFLKSRDK
jgi:pimeloyl-ACP methyl ester carboxylesterase